MSSYLKRYGNALIPSGTSRVSVLWVCISWTITTDGFLFNGLLGYSMTLFQGLATAAGFDPVRGPGSSCLDAGASGQCVLPWGKGTKSISSIVLISNGLSFAVRASCIVPTLIHFRAENYLKGHDPYLHYHWISGGLWKLW